MNQFLDFDQKLYAELRKGSEHAFVTVFRQYNRLLYALAYRYFKSGEEAEDAVQYTFMKLWEQRERFDFQSGIRSLLFTILKNYILNELRHRNLVFEKHYEMAQKDEEADDGFLKDFEDKDFREHLRAAIGKLPPQKQRICRLKIEKGLSNQEIADEMHITVPTVKSHYTQAIKILSAEIESLIVLLHVLWIHFLG